MSTKVKKMLFILSKATIENAYAAFVMANGARMEGIESEIFFTFFGLEAIQKKKLEHLRVATVGNPGMHIPTMLGGLPGVETAVSGMMRKQMEALDMPPVDEFLEMITAGGGKIYACKLAIDMFKLKKEDLWDEVDSIITIGEFYEMCDGDRTQIIFT